jgi:hypothetical protein
VTVQVPDLSVEVAFPAGASTSTLLHLDDPTRGKLDTGTLGDATDEEPTWVSITPYVLSGTIKRGSTRIDSPTITYETGSLTLVLDNTDRRFDPSNLDGPYVGHSGLFSVDGSALNSNTGFESGTTGWTAVGGTLTQDATQQHSGTYSGKMTPDGVSALVHADSALLPVTAGDTYRAAAWIRHANSRFTNLNVNWYTAASAYISTSSTGVLPPAATWVFQSADFTAPPTAAFAKVITSQSGTPAVGDILWSDDVTFTHLSDLITQVTAMRAVRVRATWAGVTYELFRGFADQWDISWSGPAYSECVLAASDGFKVLAGVNRPAVPAIGAGETTGARIGRILDSADWPAADRVIATGDSTVKETTLDGTALAELQLVADSELGELYIDGGGRVVFRNRNALLQDARSAASQGTFGDQDETLFYDDLGIATDDVTFYNQVRAVRAAVDELDVPVEQLAEDTASQALFYPKTFKPTAELVLETDGAVLAWAQWLVYVSRDPELRFTTLTLDPRESASALYPQALGREIGDRITVVRRPPPSGVITRDEFIRGVAHDFADQVWTTIWTLQSADKYGSFLTLDDPTLGVLNNNALAY